MENTKQQTLTTPMAIVAAGFLIMVGLLLTGGINGAGSNSIKNKTLSEQVGVNKVAFDACVKGTDLQALKTRTDASAELAMKGLPPEQRGTPYSVIIGKNGVKTEIRGAYPKEEVQKLIDEVNSGKVTTPYRGEVPAYEEGDHIIGNPDAQIVIIEYADLECPYCKNFGGTMKDLVSGSNGNIAWIYRHWVVHPTALPKAGAAECVAKLKGNDAFWKYIDLVFGLMNPVEAPVSEQL